jgi:thiol-disulfide isomerase/thioredoxin
MLTSLVKAFLLILVPQLVFSQTREYDIYGELTGEHAGQIHLFFDGHFRQRDSIGSEIVNGKFHFHGRVAIPVLARIHLDATSLIADLYLDGSSLDIQCTNRFQITHEGKDTLNLLHLVSSKGSAMEGEKTAFEGWAARLKDSALPAADEERLYYKKLFGFVSRHRKEKVSLYLISEARTLTMAHVQALSRLTDASLAGSYEAGLVSGLITDIAQRYKDARWDTGTPFHDVALVDDHGKPCNTKDFRDSLELVLCWASWCGPCREEHPAVRRLYEKYKDRGLQVVGLSLDTDKSKWLKAIAADSLSWPQLIDTNAFKGGVADYYGIESIPADFILDRKGRIVFSGSGSDVLTGAVDSLFSVRR